MKYELSESQLEDGLFPDKSFYILISVFVFIVIFLEQQKDISEAGVFFVLF